MDLPSLLAGWTHVVDDATLAVIATNHQAILGAFFFFTFLMLLIVQLQLLASNASSKKEDKGLCNYKIKKNEAKVVDFVSVPDMEDMAQFKDGKLVMCRCWKSENFPYCDGSHVKHNKECGDNCGPLIIKKET